MLRLDSGVSALGTGASATTLREIRYSSPVCDTDAKFTETDCGHAPCRLLLHCAPTLAKGFAKSVAHAYPRGPERCMGASFHRRL